jgi:hypothetical protein
METRNGDERLHEAASRMARACRRIIQGCLRDEEWRDADEEFYRVILAGLEELNHERQIFGGDQGGRGLRA